MKRIWIATAVLLAAGCSPSVGSNRPNVLVVALDSVRADHLGCQGHDRLTSPALDALASEGVRFERAYSVAPWGLPSVASMVTGRFPGDLGVRGLADGLPDGTPTLAELLAARGYATAAVVSDFLLGGARRLSRGYGSFEDGEARGDEHLSTPGVTRQARARLRELAQGEDPFFLFVHYYDPHASWMDHPEVAFATDAVEGLRGGESIQELRLLSREMSAAQLAFVRDLYDEEIRAADEGVGELLAELESLGLDEQTLVLVTGTCGQEFMEHGWIGPATGLHEESVRVPLLVRAPVGSRRQGVVSLPVSTASLAPTILDLLALSPPPPGTFRAPSLAALVQGRPPPDPGPVYLEVDFDPPIGGSQTRAVHQRAVVGRRFKLIRCEDSGRMELYDLNLDPGERQDVAAGYPEELERLRQSLDRHLGGG